METASELWKELFFNYYFKLKNSGGLGEHVFNLSDSIILLIEGIESIYKEGGVDLKEDPDMVCRIQHAIDSIKEACSN